MPSDEEILKKTAKDAGIDLNDKDVEKLTKIVRVELKASPVEVRIREGVGVNSKESPTLFPPDARDNDIVRYSYTEGGNGWCFKRPDGTIVCR